MLVAMPRMSRRQWEELSLFRRWLVSARAGVLVMSFASAALGGLLVFGHPDWSLAAWVVCTAGLLLAHAANNQLNDYTDHALGIDRGNYFRLRYGVHVLEDGFMSRAGLLRYLIFSGGLAAAAGGWLVWRTGPELMIPFALGGFFLLFYTWPLKGWGLGEVAVLLGWGPLMVGGSAMAATGDWDWRVAGIGLVYALGPTSVIFGKHIDKVDFDRGKGVATLPVRLGEARARAWVRWMLAGQYVMSAVLVAAGWLPWPVALVLLALPVASRVWRTFGAPAPETAPEGFPAQVWPLWFSAHAFHHTRWFSLLFVAGVGIGLMLP